MATKRTPRSLFNYMRDKRRQHCEVCKLSPALKEEMLAARTRKITRAQVLEWLGVEHGIKLTAGQLDSHYSARHDQETD